MFYEPDKGNHGLPRNPFKSCVVPRPIGWITTLCDDGRINLAPFSQFNILGFDPGYVVFSASTHRPDWRRKDSICNAERQGEFVYNMATYDLREPMRGLMNSRRSLNRSRHVGLQWPLRRRSSPIRIDLHQVLNKVSASPMNP